MIYPEDYAGLLFATTVQAPDGATGDLAGVQTLTSVYDPLPQHMQSLMGDSLERALLQPAAGGGNSMVTPVAVNTSLVNTITDLPTTIASYAALALLAVLLIVVGAYVALQG